MAEVKEKSKGPLGKFKELAEDKEEQLEILGAMVRLGVVIWSGFIITLNYVELPIVKKTCRSIIRHHFCGFDFYGSTSYFWIVYGQF